MHNKPSYIRIILIRYWMAEAFPERGSVDLLNPCFDETKPPWGQVQPAAKHPDHLLLALAHATLTSTSQSIGFPCYAWFHSGEKTSNNIDLLYGAYFRIIRCHKSQWDDDGHHGMELNKTCASEFYCDVLFQNSTTNSSHGCIIVTISSWYTTC